MSAIGLAVASILPPVYRATARMLVETPQIPGNLAQSTVPVNAIEQIEIIQQRLMTRANLLGLADRFDIYADREGSPQATTAVPAAVLDEFACLKCVSVTHAGAYLSWGVPKDLFVPHDEQQTPMVEGRSYVAVVCLDRAGERLIASTRLGRHFDYDISTMRVNQAVKVLVYGFNEQGAHVVVDNRFRGMVYHNEVYRELRVGDQMDGWIKAVRGDRSSSSPGNNLRASSALPYRRNSSRSGS